MENQIERVYIDDEEEIDLKVLLYKALKEWRKAVVWGIIIGLLCAGWSVLGDLRVINDPDAYAKALSNYEAAYTGWASTEEVLNNQIDDLNIKSQRQAEYNEKSVKMAIDAKDKWTGKLTYFIDYNYQINPQLSYQDTDYTRRILAAYSSFISGGELKNAIMDQTDFTEQKYLNEVFSAWVDYDASTLNYTIIGKSEKDINFFLNMLAEETSKKTAEICASVAQHSVNELTHITYSEVDDDLADLQRNNSNLVQQYQMQIGEVSDELLEWKDTDEPVFDYSVGKIIKGAIKYAIIGGFVGLCLVFGYVAVMYLLSGKFHMENLRSCGMTYVVGTIYRDKEKKQEKCKLFAWIDSLVEKLWDPAEPDTGFKESCSLTASNINNLMQKKDFQKLALVGALDEALARQIESKLKKSCEVTYLGDILSNPEAVALLKSYTHVAILAIDDESTVAELIRENENITAFGKNNLGVVVIL